MPLLNLDVKRIQSLGFNRKFFTKISNGWVQLKNKNGKCVFNNGIICVIYKNRLEGCRLYPIIYDKDKNCATLDSYCPYKENFKISKNKTKLLFTLVLKLEYEKAQRKSEKDRYNSAN